MFALGSRFGSIFYMANPPQAFADASTHAEGSVLYSQATTETKTFFTLISAKFLAQFIY